MLKSIEAGVNGRGILLEVLGPIWMTQRAELVEALSGTLCGGDRDLRVAALRLVLLSEHLWTDATRQVLSEQLPRLYRQALEQPTDSEEPFDRELLEEVVRGLGAIRHTCLVEDLRATCVMITRRDDDYSKRLEATMLASAVQVTSVLPDARRQFREQCTRVMSDSSLSARGRRLGAVLFLETLHPLVLALPTITPQHASGADLPLPGPIPVTQDDSDYGALDGISGSVQTGAAVWHRIREFYQWVSQSNRPQDEQWARAFYQELVNLAAGLTGSYGSYVTIPYDPGRIRLRRASAGISDRAIRTSMASGECAEGFSATERAPLVLNIASEIASYPGHFYSGAVSQAIMPVVADGQCIGALTCVSLDESGYRPGHIAVMAVLLSGLDHVIAGIESERKMARSMSSETAIADLAHIFRAPIGRVAQSMQMVLDDVQMPDTHKDLLNRAVISAEITYREATIYLHLQKADVQTLHQGTPIACPAKVLAGIQDLLDRYAQASNRQLLLPAVVSSPGYLQISEEHLELVLWELTINALRNSASSVSLEFGRDGEYLAITTTNDCDSADSLDVDEVFEEFYQSPSEPTSTRGSASDRIGGWGLSFVKRVAADHGGSVECARTPDGLQFRFRLPLGRPEGDG
jgi:signal transduction histidine kinase